jgi:hypothetical protein
VGRHFVPAVIPCFFLTALDSLSYNIIFMSICCLYIAQLITIPKLAFEAKQVLKGGDFRLAVIWDQLWATRNFL